MMKINILIYMFFLLLAKSCLGIKTDTKPPSANDTEIAPQLAAQIEGLETYMRSTHFTGHISNISINTQKLPDASPDDSLIEEIHIVNADILEIFIGMPIDKIEFKIITEENEIVEFDKAAIISLCKSNDEFFWAGSGSVFPANPLFIQKATQIKNAQTANIIPSFCE